MLKKLEDTIRQIVPEPYATKLVNALEAEKPKRGRPRKPAKPASEAPPDDAPTD